MKLPTSGMLIGGPNNSQLQLDDFLGRGSFGTVFQAHNVTDGTLYAVKFPESVFEGEARKIAFLNEVRASQEIQHPNVVRVLHVEVDSAELTPYLVMEFIAGGTLYARLNRIRASNSMTDLAYVQIWTESLVEGIAAINAKMLHRDLKPDNILMDGDIPKIGDFGLSKVIGMPTRSRTFKGGQHLLYMAPEGWKYEKNEIQIDMYAMGIVFYELASLQYPYQLPQNPFGSEPFRSMHLYQEVRPLQERRSDLPLGFCHVVSRLLEKNPQDRFPNWLEVQQALDKAWNTHKNPASDLPSVVQALLHETGRRHEEYTRHQLEEMRRQKEQEEQSQLDHVQQRKLLNMINDQIAEYNEHAAFKEKIEEVQTNGGFGWQLPFGGTISLRFFSIDPPLQLPIGHVRFAAVLEDPDNVGLNYLLCRNSADDLYGHWKVCHIRQVFLGKPSSGPFGFNDANIRVLEDSSGFSHQFEFSDKVEREFLQVALEAIKRRESR